MKTAHILLVDDDPISNKWLTAALTAANYQVSSVEDAKTAWQLLTTRTHTYQLVIIDRMMFGMSGMDLLRQIQMSPSLKKYLSLSKLVNADRKNISLLLLRVL
ncbi:MAG: response regulator transcription factor [Coxiellaceae bacterium]|nr:MAG: response regulator transcription factor [Coxiellaceae bacterium]